MTTQSEVPVGTVVRIGHPDNNLLAVRWLRNGYYLYRWLSDGSLVDPEDFRAGWDLHSTTTLASPATVEFMCHWVQGRGDAATQTHEAFHFDNPCPYAAVAAVMRGEPDPREAPVRCDTCGDTGEVKQQQEIGVPGSGAWLTCPDCRPSPAVPTNGPTGE